MSHVFISYSHDDTDVAFALRYQIEQEAVHALIDRIILSPGDRLGEDLQAAIDNSFAVLVVCTKRSMESQEVCFEWAYAMGKGIPVIPILYESGCKLHSRLRPLIHLDFSETRNRPWTDLLAVLAKKKKEYEPTIGLPRKSGLRKIAFSRQELTDEYSIDAIFKSVKPNSKLIVVARSCEAWAREYLDLQTVADSKSVQIKLAMVDPGIPKEQWMIISDHGIFDIKPTFEKLSQIKIAHTSRGRIELYFLPSSPFYSFVYFENEQGERIGILESGASLPLTQRTTLVFRVSGNEDAVMLDRLLEVYSRIFEGRKPAFSASPPVN